MYMLNPPTHVNKGIELTLEADSLAPPPKVLELLVQCPWCQHVRAESPYLTLQQYQLLNNNLADLSETFWPCLEKWTCYIL